MKNNTTRNQIKNVNGIEYFHVGKGKWSFKGVRADGTPIEKFERVGGGENAAKVAKAIGASLKRNFVGVEIVDSMARGQISRIIPQVPTYKVINFAENIPQQN